MLGVFHWCKLTLAYTADVTEMFLHITSQTLLYPNYLFSIASFVSKQRSVAYPS